MLAPPLAPGKFIDPLTTRKGEARAAVPFRRLQTLWVNTGTLCNIECRSCYIESSPTNDRLAYVNRAELAPFLCEAAAMGAEEIGFTGGEPFLNPDLAGMAEDALGAGFRVLILTNAMRPAMRPAPRTAMKRLASVHGPRLTLRVSLDYHSRDLHDAERGAGAFDTTIAGLKALAADGAHLAVAGRSHSGETDEAAREAYRRLFAAHGLPIDAGDPAALVIFPEMDARLDTPEITEACWDILKKTPDDVMCASSRMVVKRKGAAAPAVLACTLIVDDPQFELGATLGAAARAVRLNHPHCSRFCVLGGASCS